METDAEITADEAKHYILQTPQTFLDDYNARDDVKVTFSSLTITLFIIFDGEVLHEGYPSGRLLSHRVKHMHQPHSIARICYKILRNPNCHFEDAQIMEPAFKFALLELDVGDEAQPGVLLSVLVTVSAPPRWKEPVKGQMSPLASLRKGMKTDDPVHAAFIEQVIERANSFSKKDLLGRFSRRVEFAHMRMCSLLCYLENWVAGQQDVEFWVGIVQIENSHAEGFILFETSRNVLDNMVNDPLGHRDVIFETDEKYALKGVCFRNGRDPIVTSLHSFRQDPLELVFESSGRLKMKWMSTEQTERIEKLVLSGGHRSTVVNSAFQR